MHKIILSLLFCGASVSAMELIESKHVSSKDKLKLYTNHKDIFVEDENAAYRVEKHNMNPLLKEVIQRKALDKFIGDGYVRVNKHDEGTYELLAKVRGDGGGLVLATIAYGAVKVLAYSGIIATTGAAAAAVGGTGGTATPAVVALGVAAKGSIGMSLAGSMASAALASSAAAPLLVEGTVATIATAGGTTAAYGLVETAAMSAFNFCLALPTW